MVYLLRAAVRYSLTGRIEEPNGAMGKPQMYANGKWVNIENKSCVHVVMMPVMMVLVANTPKTKTARRTNMKTSGSEISSPLAVNGSKRVE